MVVSVKSMSVSHFPRRRARSPHPRTPLLAGNLIGLQATHLLFQSFSQNVWQPAHVFKGLNGNFMLSGQTASQLFLAGKQERKTSHCLNLFCRGENGKQGWKRSLEGISSFPAPRKDQLVLANFYRDFSNLFLKIPCDRHCMTCPNSDTGLSPTT